MAFATAKENLRSLHMMIFGPKWVPIGKCCLSATCKISSSCFGRYRTAERRALLARHWSDRSARQANCERLLQMVLILFAKEKLLDASSWGSSHDTAVLKSAKLHFHSPRSITRDTSTETWQVRSMFYTEIKNFGQMLSCCGVWLR